MHAHHQAAHGWFAEKGHRAWATCPLTENGYIRIASHPSYPNRPGDVSAVSAILRQLRESQGHHFWADDISLLDILDPAALLTHAHITDVYLLGLAVKKRGRLATFDRRIPTGAVRDGREGLELIEP